MKKLFIIAFFAVSFIVLTTVNFVGAQEGGFVKATEPQEVSDAPGNITYNWLWYNTITPCRATDTRLIWFCNPCAAGEYYLDVQYDCPQIPATAKAVMVNIAAVNMTGGGYVTAWPTGDPRPLSSVLNYGVVSGLPAISNAVIVPVNPNETYEMSFYLFRAVDIVVDAMGWFD